MPNDVIAGSSPAPDTEALPIEQWSNDQRTEWLKTGSTPELPKTAADPAPAETQPSEASPAEVQDEDETPAPESEPEKPKEPAEHKISPAEKRIKQLLAKNRELEERLNATAKPAEAKKPEGKPETQPATGKPKPESFQTYDEYVEALADWRWEQREQSQQQAETQRKQTEQQQEIAKSWDAKKAKAIEAHPDFDDVLATADVSISEAMHEAIVTSDAGPEMAYHLATHLHQAKRIAALSPVAQVRELGKLEAQLSAPPPPKKTTSASKPPTELPARATQTGDEAADALKAGDFGRYRRIMNSRETKGK